MFKIFSTKKKKIPTGEDQEIDVVDTWAVRWTSRYGEYSGDIMSSIEVFPTQSEAGMFADELKRAFKLLKHSGEGTGVRVLKNN